MMAFLRAEGAFVLYREEMFARLQWRIEHAPSKKSLAACRTLAQAEQLLTYLIAVEVAHPQEVRSADFLNWVQQHQALPEVCRLRDAWNRLASGRSLVVEP